MIRQDLAKPAIVLDLGQTSPRGTEAGCGACETPGDRARSNLDLLYGNGPYARRTERPARAASAS